jgi:Uma2 family endonuclease
METAEQEPLLGLEELSGLELGDWLEERGKPGWEWIAGRPVQKLMGTDWHSFMQAELVVQLRAWQPEGKVGPEWRITPPPNNYETRSLVPDVVYLSAPRYYALPKGERRYPTVAPEVVVEILSPRQSMSQINIKRRVCLGWGVALVLVIDPYAATLIAYHAERPEGTSFARTDTFTKQLAGLPPLTLSLPTIFALTDEL